MKTKFFASMSALVGVVVIAALLSLQTGCVARSELTVQREAIAAGVQTPLDEHLEWSRAIAGVPGHSLPDLSSMSAEQKQSWVNSRVRQHTEFDTWLEQGRKRDSDSSWFGGGSSKP